MHVDDVSLHNVAELRDGAAIDDALAGGQLLQRLPEAVRTELNSGAQNRYRHPAGVEVRFVQTADEPVTVTLSATGASDVEVFWGPFHERSVTVGPGETTIECSRPDPLGKLRPEVRDELAYSPDICRLRLAGAHRGGLVAFHEAAGPRRPPTGAELPDETLLAYGTSITEGEAPSAETVTYVAETARRLGTDLRNLGTCGSAYCEPAVADYLASQEFDVASLALSVNMIDAFELATFEERAATMVETVAGENPETPVAAVTLYPYYDDLLVDGDREKAAAFRETLREVVAAAERENLHLVEGPAMLDAGGLRADVLHPADAGMITMGERLSGELAELV